MVNIVKFLAKVAFTVVALLILLPIKEGDFNITFEQYIGAGAIMFVSFVLLLRLFSLVVIHFSLDYPKDYEDRAVSIVGGLLITIIFWDYGIPYFHSMLGSVIGSAIGATLFLLSYMLAWLLYTRAFRPTLKNVE